MTAVDKFLVTPNRSVRDAITIMEGTGEGLLLIVDDDQKLIAVITDGDVRRAMLARVVLDDPVTVLLAHKPPGQAFQRPLSRRVGTSQAELLHLLNEQKLRHIPIVDDDGRVVDIALLSLFSRELEQTPAMQAVIMAGGFGTRLRPLTESVPKPMLPVGDRPLMEHVINAVSGSGVHQVYVTTHYKPEKIKEHFGDGDNFGVDLTYVAEDEPLGTAGALRLMAMPTEPLLVINGDILTNLDFRAMRHFHDENEAVMTVGVRSFDYSVPYGVVQMDGVRVSGIVEKPTYTHFVSAGMYILSPKAVAAIPAGRRFDMTDLITVLAQEGCKVVSFPIMEYWLDIGRPADYQQAQKDMAVGVCRRPNER